MLKSLRSPALVRPTQSLIASSARCKSGSFARIRHLSSVTDLKSYPSVGESLHGFTVQQTKHVPELHLTAILLQHNKTRADYVHVARDDDNNVFGIGFKTNPPDSKGVPHILEHTVLCGSEKYPVRDPFFKMLPRSLSNFMNALTSSHCTYYPFATTNKQDFQNLLSVYLDATFHPLLKEEDFRQEGWRLGLAQPEVANNNPGRANAVFKGVVYNEMKGQMSDANYLYYIKFKEQICPALNNSGGDPRYITDLSHEELVKFCKENYHPTNAKIFTYGNMPLSDHLQQLQPVLDQFDQAPANLDVKLPRTLVGGPYSVTTEGPIDPFAPLDKQYKTSLSWIAGDTTDLVETFALELVSSLLLDGYGSPMYKALIESHIASSFTPNTGLDPTGRSHIFSVGVNGVSEADAAAVATHIKNVLQETVKTGFRDDKVQGLLHQLELALRHKTAEFGLAIMNKIIDNWFNGSHPVDELAWNEVVDEFKRRYTQGGYLESLVQKYLLNDNYLSFKMIGSPTFNESLEKEESTRMNAKLDSLESATGSTEAAIEQIQKGESELLQGQESAQASDLSCLPTLHVKEIPRQKERKTLRESTIDDTAVVWREAPTNGLSYFQALNVLNGLPNDLQRLLPLFTNCILRLGTKNRTMEQWEDLIKLKTGGISLSSFVTSSPTLLDAYEEGIQFFGYALDSRFPDLLEILSTLIRETDFDGPLAPAMIQELLRSSTDGALDAVSGSGHRFAVQSALSPLSRKYWVGEQQTGLAQIQATAALLTDATNSSECMDEILQKLRTIQSFALSRSPGFRIRMVCEPGTASANETGLQKWLSSLSPPTQASFLSADAGISSPAGSSDKVLYKLPYQVSYTGLAFRTVPYVDESSAPLSVLSQLLTHNFLHPEIREKGGAYGAFASGAPLSGNFSLSSYRDPSPINTFKTFQKAGVFARDRTWTERELEEAKLGIFKSLDAPVDVVSEGESYFMSGVTHEMRQRWRERVFDVSAKDINGLAQRFLVDEGRRRVFSMLGGMKDGFNTEGWDIRDLKMTDPNAI